MLVQSATHFALDYFIQSACRYFETSISSNKVWGISEVECTTGKNSACEGFGQNFVSDFSNLAILE
ncbi:hypothetical protein AB6C46_21825 [Vibrio sp. 10N.237.312.C02]|uniref:hypothetical protein n=1 Tax=unclassified Vibrio TaxID=2614977 RepID=UPI00352CA216